MSASIGSSNHSAAYKAQIAAAGNSQPSVQQRLSNLFQQIDTAGTGRITNTQFEQSFSKLSLPKPVKDLGHEAILNKLDPAGKGVITKSDFIQKMELLMNQKSATPSKASSVETTQVSKSATSNASQSASSEMSPLDGIVLGHIIDTTA
jgi:hypothetical protein